MCTEHKGWKHTYSFRAYFLLCFCCLALYLALLLCWSSIILISCATILTYDSARENNGKMIETIESTGFWSFYFSAFTLFFWLTPCKFSANTSEDFRDILVLFAACLLFCVYFHLLLETIAFSNAKKSSALPRNLAPKPALVDLQAPTFQIPGPSLEKTLPILWENWYHVCSELSRLSECWSP